MTGVYNVPYSPPPGPGRRISSLWGKRSIGKENQVGIESGRDGKGNEKRKEGFWGSNNHSFPLISSYERRGRGIMENYIHAWIIMIYIYMYFR